MQQHVIPISCDFTSKTLLQYFCGFSALQKCKVLFNKTGILKFDCDLAKEKVSHCKVGVSSWKKNVRCQIGHFGIIPTPT